MKAFLSVMLILLCMNAEAKLTKLAVITSEFDKDVMDFYVITNGANQVDSIRYIQTAPNGAIISDMTVPVERVMEKGGVVIVERDGHNAVILEVENFNVAKGGVIKLNYLHNGVTGTRHVKYSKLNMVNGRFALADMENNAINRMFLKVNYIRLIGVVGIREIVTGFAKDTEALLASDLF